MNNERGMIPDSHITSFLKRLEEVGYAHTNVTSDFIVWVAHNISCTIVNKNLKKDADLSFFINDEQQFSLYYQIVMNKLFFVIAEKNNHIQNMINDTLVPLFEPTYRKKFTGNNLRKKDNTFYIDVAQFNDSRVFNEITRIISMGFPGNSPVSATQQAEAKEYNGALPSKEDFELAYRKLVRPGEGISIDSVLDQIEINAKKKGTSLKSNWRMVTEQSIEIWSKKRS